MFVILLFSIANVYRLHKTTKQKDSFFWYRVLICCRKVHKGIYTQVFGGRGKSKLQFICLIGGRVCNPRQQHALNIYLKSLSDYKQHAAAAGYKPTPQLGR